MKPAAADADGRDGGDGERLMLTGGRDCTLHLWDLSQSTGSGAKKSRVYTYDSIASGCVDWGGEGGAATAAVGSRNGVVALWDVAKGAKKGSLRGHEGEVTALTTCAAPGPGGGDAGGGGVFFVSGGADGTARVWDPRQAREVCVLTGHRRRVYSLAAGPGGAVQVETS
jgi:WD40 repeat protein